MALAGRGLVELLARAGYVAKGCVFLAVGGLALMAVFGFSGGVITGTGGAIHTLGRTFPGRVFFGLMAVGLAAHVTWRIWQALVDPAEKGHGALAVVQRSGFLISAGLYTTVVISIVSAVTGLLDGGRSAADATDMIVDLPGGYVMLLLLGIGIILTGIYQAWRALAQPFRAKWFDAGPLSYGHPLMAVISSYGIGMRALLFLMLGWHVVRAGWFRSEDEIMGLATALWRISTEEFGGVLLALMASGLMAYGCYCLFNAAFRRLEKFPGQPD
jgi:hypothetical protein